LKVIVLLCKPYLIVFPCSEDSVCCLDAAFELLRPPNRFQLRQHQLHLPFLGLNTRSPPSEPEIRLMSQNIHCCYSHTGNFHRGILTTDFPSLSWTLNYDGGGPSYAIHQFGRRTDRAPDRAGGTVKVMLNFARPFEGCLALLVVPSQSSSFSSTLSLDPPFYGF